ncbi:hypothetical protein [Rhizomonospora bruguierae]|uniref:hypothetical protein n=1 Tax=Rhizomonospora bruguierae TaxID=1581705 RepID=UPI0020C0F368|nr:hypothetical protein [Micromonospora sp. NBRC 107566]
MPTLAATATQAGSAAGMIILILTIVTLGYLTACMIRPFRRCRRCNGTGSRRSLILRAGRTCRRCDGHGEHLRTGRVAINYLRELHDKGTPR